MKFLSCLFTHRSRHFEPSSIKYLLYYGAEREQDVSNLLRNDLVITTYDILKAEHPTNSKRKSKRSGLLHSVDWRRVVLDEGEFAEFRSDCLLLLLTGRPAHIIRNRSSQVFSSVNTLQARHRWCLTGTPIQNRVEDLGALVSFLRVHPFDTPVQFHTTFVSSMQSGNNRGIEKLKALVRAISLRRTKQSVFEELRLGPRVERLQSVELNEEERTLYTIVKRWTYAAGISDSMRSVFQIITKLRQICDHGRDLLSLETLAVLDQGYINGGQIELMSRAPQSCENCGAAMQGLDSGKIDDFLLSCMHLLCSQCFPKNQGGNTEEELCPVCSGDRTYDSFLEDEQVTEPFPDPSQIAMNIDFMYSPSSKVLALLQNLHADRLGSVKYPIKR